MDHSYRSLTDEKGRIAISLIIFVTSMIVAGMLMGFHPAAVIHAQNSTEGQPENSTEYAS